MPYWQGTSKLVDCVLLTYWQGPSPRALYWHGYQVAPTAHTGPLPSKYYSTVLILTVIGNFSILARKYTLLLIIVLFIITKSVLYTIMNSCIVHYHINCTVHLNIYYYTAH